MNYEQIRNRLKDLNHNLQRAITQNDGRKQKHYKYLINDLKLQKEKYELEQTATVLKEQEQIIERLEQNLADYESSQKALRTKIEELEAKLNDMVNTLTGKVEEVKEEPKKIKCPKCGRLYTEAGMPRHQQHCKS